MSSVPRFRPPEGRYWPGLLRSSKTLLVALFLLAFGPRLWVAAKRGFWIDELTSVGIASLELPEVLQAIASHTNMVLYHWLLFGWLRVVGIGADEALIRLPSVVFGAATVCLTYLLGCRLHSGTAGLAAAGLLALNGYHLMMSVEARSYPLFGATTVLSFLLLDRGLRRRGRWDWALLGVVNALSFYSHLMTALTIMGQAAFVASRRSQAILLDFVKSGVLTALIVAPFVPLLLRSSGQSSLNRFNPIEPAQAIEVLVDLSGGSYGLLGAYLGLAVLGVTWSGPGARSSAYRNLLLLSWLLVPLGFLLIMQLGALFQRRHLMEVLPAMVLLAGVGLARLPRLGALALFCLVAVLSVNVLREGFWVHAREEWRSAVNYAVSRAQPGDGWIFISKWGQDGFEYYAGWNWGRNTAAPYEHVLEPYDRNEVDSYQSYRGLQRFERLPPFAAEHSRIWLVQSHETSRATGVNAADPVLSFLETHGYRPSSREFRGVKIVLWQQKA